jgi:hydrogenase/urease accessory protein HupE
MTKQVLGALVLLAICAWWPIAHAHEVRPGFLEIRSLGDDTFDVLWKVPANGEYRLAMYVKLPVKCKAAVVRHVRGRGVRRALASRLSRVKWGARCHRRTQCNAHGRPGAVHSRGCDHADRAAHAGRHSFEIAAEPNAWQVARPIFAGIQHILSGVDHLLFVLGCCSWSAVGADWWPRSLLSQWRTASLAAATLGLVYVPQTPIEAAIALSVMFVAAEIIHQANGRPGLTARAPWVVAFIFGLLHGFGFAGALREVGLPQSDIPVALLFFNVGVEVGQLMFILAVVAILWLASRLMGKQAQGQRGPWQAEALIRTPVAYVVGSTAAFWVVQRVVAFWA